MPEREQITWPDGAEAAVGWLRGLHEEWRTGWAQLTDADLDLLRHLHGARRTTAS